MGSPTSMTQSPYADIPGLRTDGTGGNYPTEDPARPGASPAPTSVIWISRKAMERRRWAQHRRFLFGIEWPLPPTPPRLPDTARPARSRSCEARPAPRQLIGVSGTRPPARPPWGAVPHPPKSRGSRATAVSGPTRMRAASWWAGLTTTLVSRPAVTTAGTNRRADLRSSIQARPKALATAVSRGSALAHFAWMAADWLGWVMGRAALPIVGGMHIPFAIPECRVDSFLEQEGTAAGRLPGSSD